MTVPVAPAVCVPRSVPLVEGVLRTLRVLAVVTLPPIWNLEETVAVSLVVIVIVRCTVVPPPVQVRTYVVLDGVLKV